MLPKSFLDSLMIIDGDDISLYQHERCCLDVNLYENPQKAFLLLVLYPNIDGVRFRNVLVQNPQTYDFLEHFNPGMTVRIEQEMNEFTISAQNFTLPGCLLRGPLVIKSTDPLYADAIMLSAKMRRYVMEVGRSFRLNARLSIKNGKLFDTSIPAPVPIPDNSTCNIC